MISTGDAQFHEHCIAFLVNYFEPKIKLPLEVVPGIRLRTAKAQEEELFQGYDKAANIGRGDARIYRHRIPLVGPITVQTNEDFRQYVLGIGFLQWARSGGESHSPYERLELACSIAESALRPVVVCEARAILTPLRHDLHRHIVLRRRALDRFLAKIPQLTSTDIDEIRTIAILIKDLKQEHAAFVVEAIERFKQVELVSLASDFHTFALFTIVEYLLTHSPRPDDESDTLTKQVCAKCSAIAMTFDHAIPIGQFFLEENEERAWKILYNYRSKIAHGGSVDFSKRFTKTGFAELNDHKHVQAFLHLYVRRLLKSTLRDPEWVRSLKRE
jgi:5-methylcytosine-specific restriction endonuclease McrA